MAASMYSSIAVIPEEGTYKVFGYNGNIQILYQSRSQDECDEWADEYARTHNMYYDREQEAYYMK